MELLTRTQRFEGPPLAGPEGVSSPQRFFSTKILDYDHFGPYPYLRGP